LHGECLKGASTASSNTSVYKWKKSLTQSTQINTFQHFSATNRCTYKPYPKLCHKQTKKWLHKVKESGDFYMGNYRTKKLNCHISAKNEDIDLYPTGMVIRHCSEYVESSIFG